MPNDGLTLEREEAFDGLDVCRCCYPSWFEPMDLRTPVANAIMTLNEEEARNLICTSEQHLFADDDRLEPGEA